MVLENICGPVILYLGFSLIQIIMDIFKNLYNTAFLKFMIMIVFSVILNLLCKMNMSIISWFLVLLPYIILLLASLRIYHVSEDQKQIMRNLQLQGAYGQEAMTNRMRMAA